VYGYEKWIGISKNNIKDKIEKTFLKARLNWGRTKEYYCDSEILNDPQVGILTYNILYSEEIVFGASDFADEFINDRGGGQYFFNCIDKDVYLDSCKEKISTNRLRTSYIENKYFVLSPKREGAGEANLELYFYHSVSFWTFDISMWGSLEDSANESLEVLYFRKCEWFHHIWIEPKKLSTLKDYPDSFSFLFPQDTEGIKFVAKSSNPSESRNKGRIVLDNFHISYNDVNIWD